jgi:hypothetical protein
MPIDPSIPLRGVQPQVAMPWEIEQQQLTLRDLLDQRKMRDMQLEQEGLKLNETKRSLGAQERIRQILARNPDLKTALPQIYREDLSTGMSVEKHNLEQQKTRLDLVSAQNKVSGEDIELIGRLAGGVRAVPEAEKQNAWTNALATAKALGKDVSNFPAQYNAAVVDQLLQWALDAKAQEQRRQWEVTNNREETKFNDEQVARALQEMGAARGQADFDRVLSRVAPNLRNRLPAMYSPATVDYANRASMTSAQAANVAQQKSDAAATAQYRQDTLQQQKDFHKDTVKHQNDMAGIARGNLNARNNALTAAQNKGSEDYRKKSAALLNMEKALASYTTALDTSGTQWRTGTKEWTALKTAYTDLQMQLKNAYELGALAGPDLALLENAITDPTGLKGNYYGKDALKAQLGVIKTTIERNKNTLAEVYQRQQLQADVDASQLSTEQLLGIINAGK